MNIFLENLEKILYKLEKNRSWLSKKTLIPMSTVNSWFSNDTPPKIDDAYRVGSALNISLDALMTDNNSQNIKNNNPVLNKLINFLNEQDNRTLDKIEANLTMLNNMNLSGTNENTPAFILDSEMKVTWVNKTFASIFGNENNFMGTNLKGLIGTPNDRNESQKSGLLSINNEKGLMNIKNTPDGSENFNSPFLSVLNNFILLPVFDSINKSGKPTSYAGVFCNIVEMNKEILKNIFLNFYKMLLVKDQNMNIEFLHIGEFTKILSLSLMGHNDYPEINPRFIESISETAFLCDIGNIGIPDDILNKHGDLDEWELKIIKDHTISGGYILNNYPDPIAKDIAIYHHEWWNGTGYPFGLSYEMIPLSARIASVCITYNALRKKTRYKDKNDLSHERAIEIIKNEKGTHFEPYIVEKFLDFEKKIMEIYDIFTNQNDDYIEYEEI